MLQNLVNLIGINLRFSSQLMELPDFSKAKNLEIIDFSFCWGLTRVHPSIFSLENLKVLDLSHSSITSLQSNIPLRSLNILNLFGCSRFKNFSVISENLTALSLGKTAINELPSSIIGSLSKLELLNLANTNIQSLPTTMKHLTRLIFLDVSDLKLQTLPELPPSIQILDVDDCTSLKTVLFPSKVAEQLKENKKSISFWNCLNLDKHSLMAIGLNAQINIMKISYQKLSALEHDYVDDYDKYYKAKATSVYPGSKVPDWLAYRTTHDDYINIDLSFAPHSTQFGFIFCFIVPKVQSYGLGLKFSMSDGEGDIINMDLDRPRNEIASDHVCLIYDQRCSHDLNSRAKNQPKFKIKVTTVTQMLNAEYVPVLLKGFGVSPINASEYHNFIQQLVLGDSKISFNN